MEHSPQGLPIIDLCGTTCQTEDSVINSIAIACEEAGCFYVKNHGVLNDVMSDTFRDFRTFFSQSLDYKMRFVDQKGNVDRGYEPFETRNVNAFMGRFGLPNDPVEKYAFGPPTHLIRPVSPNIWPDKPPSLKKNVSSYYEHSRILAEKLMRLFALALPGAEEDFFYDHCCQGEHILRANFYPRYAAPKPNQATRFGEHTDGTPFTILAMDDNVEALQVRNSNQEWVYADPVPEALFVNLGDFMARWTNDKWKAAIHRVVWPNDKKSDDRLSLVYFVQMDPGAIVKCLPSCVDAGEKPNYDPVTYSEYVNERMTRLALRY